MTQSEFSALLSAHQQWFPMSCASSGMELLLKWHGKKPNDWFGFQIEYQNQNIGWSKKGDLAQHGIQATEDRYDWTAFQAKFRSQAALGRILLFSLPTTAYLDTIAHGWKGFGEYHIFLAAEVEGKDVFTSKTFLRSDRFDIPDFKKTYDLLRQIDPNYTIDALAYDT
jgi:hypothetical protein